MKCQLPNCDELATATCRKCSIYEYCCREHQLLHWRIHKKVCGKMSTQVCEGMQLTLLEEREFISNPPPCENMNELSYKIRKNLVRKDQDRFVPTYLPEMASIYQKLPRYECIVDLKSRPCRIIGVKERMKYDMRVTTISINSKGQLFFVIGGVHPSDLRVVKYWNERMIELIKMSKHPSIFLDPLGYFLAVRLATESGYYATSAKACDCQLGAKFVIDRPFLEHEVFRVAGRTCDSCGQPGAHMHICSGCRKVAYCNVKCQKAKWPEHRAVCCKDTK